MNNPDLKEVFWGTHDMLIVCSFRYALGRRSYIVGAFTDFLKHNWQYLDKTNQELIHRETKEAIDNGNAGDPSDNLLWLEILELRVKDDQ